MRCTHSLKTIRTNLSIIKIIITSIPTCVTAARIVQPALADVRCRLPFIRKRRRCCCCFRRSSTRAHARRASAVKLLPMSTERARDPVHDTHSLHHSKPRPCTPPSPVLALLHYFRVILIIFTREFVQSRVFHKHRRAVERSGKHLENHHSIRQRRDEHRRHGWFREPYCAARQGANSLLLHSKQHEYVMRLLRCDHQQDRIAFGHSQRHYQLGRQRNNTTPSVFVT
mmetsp:Transcript_1001/g.1958  ORF Transcript_1001/g.1958 Transcript_1001/m.1958 type:complete len:227 (-) Transcript_1001:308-988(-)